MPPGIGKLTSLQTLSKFFVGKEIGCKLEELKLLNLRGELAIKNLENVRYAREASEAKLHQKHYLSSLELSWENDHFCSYSVEHFEKVLESLKPPKSLKRLCLKRYMGVKFPTWMMDALLKNVAQIKLKSCKRCELLPLLRQMPLLKVLHIRGMDSVTCIGSEFYGNGASKGFPSLKHFEIHDFPNLEEWQNFDEGQALPCIRKLVVNGCPKLRSMPHNLLSLDELELRDSKDMLLMALSSLTSVTTLRVCEFSQGLCKGRLKTLLI